MRTLRLLTLGALAVIPVCAQIEVGQGAPAGVDGQFVNAFFRSRFNGLVSLPPVSAVRRLGSTGYVQEFNDARGNAANRFALVKADGSSSSLSPVYQMYPGIYEYFSTVGVTNAGYPTSDTNLCSGQITGAAGTVCSYTIFSRNYALFAFTSDIVKADSSANYTIKDPMYTRWAALGGITGVGAPTAAEATITARSGITASTQTFANGAIYSITSGAHTGKTYAVAGKIFLLYNTLGLYLGALGLPQGEELTLSGGRFRQSFEGGSIEYTATTDAIVRSAVGGVFLNLSTTSVTRLNLGDTLNVRATTVATTGETLTDRDITWVTSNGRVATIQGTGAAVTLRAVGGGTAIINAVSEGKVSGNLTVFVAAPCCQIGEGAPTTAIQQSFQDTVSRFRLNIKLPASNPVRRVGLGYVQELVAADNPATRYLICRSDRSPGVFVVTGGMLQALEQAGGPAGALGYPVSDETATGRQLFEGGALAGNPLQVVREPLLARWANDRYEAGPLGMPLTAATNYLSFTGATGVGQSFENGFLARIQTGKFASSKVLQVRGKFLEQYSALQGPSGEAGFPITEEYNGRLGYQQDCEGGSLVLRGEDVEFVPVERSPEVIVNPGTVTAGGRVRIIVGGFPKGSRIRVSFPNQTGVAPFEIQTDQGSYSWESPVPSNSRTGPVNITAQLVGGQAQASGSYRVVAMAEASLKLTKLRGDTQTGQPGARLVRPLAVSLTDDQGTPLVGVAVRFAASPGSRVLESDIVTDESGEAEATVRLLPVDGIVLVTAEAAGKVVTFSARASGSTLTGFPKQSRLGSFAGSARENLLAAASSIIRYHQNRNELPSSQGLADPASLTTFLSNLCVLDVAGGQICDGFLQVSSGLEQLPNLWRLRDFAGNNLDIETAKGDEQAALDLLAQGIPTILALAVSDQGGVIGSHFVVLVGVDADGNLVIQDPEPQWNRTRLAEYQGGFSAGGLQIKASLVGMLRLAPRSPSPTGFLVSAANAVTSVRSERGECGAELNVPLNDGRTARAAGKASFYYCAGLEKSIVASFQTENRFEATLTDLGSPGRLNKAQGSAAAAYLATRPNAQWQWDPVRISVASADVLNAATFSPALAPGSLAAVFGTGLGVRGSQSFAEIGGLTAVVQSAGEFRLNVEIPRALPPGDHILKLESSFGAVEVPVKIDPVAPAIFQDAGAGSPVVVNATGGQRNSPYNPVARGQVISIYATGLGATRAQGNTTVTVEPVVILLQGSEISASAASPAAGLPGVYIVNVTVPAGLAPGLDIPLKLRQGGVESNVVGVSVR